ncbi:sigma-70 family RNA polymerase sigma factor [Calycomorphotria hydatis]|uniref:RNA polymerase sigma factor RpoE n=1 Tax=Calycomorphotria hydatis TaxID=2528027 RepID=A0A517TBM3_9PLAN|nr:sigma-70 family RNA polymerase sigma factor [Calycomorphotria hydatis]QDT65767.1 RNA polymerase sigma factor RpoE [Calycomorphotria hydatis]
MSQHQNDSREDRTETFLRLLTEHERKLGRYAMMLVPHAPDADEILQEAKLVMWRSFDQFETGTDFAAWSRKVVFHQVLKYRRQPSRKALPFCEETYQLLAGEASSGEEYFDRRRMALKSCLTKLTSEHQRILSLRYEEELSIERIAEEVERTAGAVYRLLSRIRRSLHECITGTLKMEAEL